MSQIGSAYPPSPNDPDAVAPRSLLARILLARIPLPFSIRHRSRRANQLIAASNLPPSLRQTIAAIVRRSHLWANEQADVAAEFICHFSAGIAAGRSEAQLLADFGNPAAAAKLIRRAKIRTRHWFWHVHHRCGQLCVAALLVLVAYYIPYFTGSPTLRHNYSAEINTHIAQIPESERAWPRYRLALLSLPVMPLELRRAKPISAQRQNWWDLHPGDPQWPLAYSYLKEAEPALHAFREASRLPTLGAPMSLEGDTEVRRHLGVPQTSGAIPSNPPLEWVSSHDFAWSALIPSLLILDARAAAIERDPDRAVADILSVLHVSDHLRENGFQFNEMIAINVFRDDVSLLSEILENDPSLFEVIHLTSIAHAIAAWHDERVSIEPVLAAERLAFEDSLQRIYTDDGHGDGRPTPASGSLFSSLDLPAFVSEAGLAGGVRALEPPMVLASRREQLAAFDKLLSTSRQVFEAAPWEDSGRGVDSEFDALPQSRMTKNRYAPAKFRVGSLDVVCRTMRKVEYLRRAALTVIAVHVFKAQTGSWPASLDSLVPRYLPTVPIDMFDGKPLKYRLISTGPLLYSVGSNRVDEGGSPTSAEDNASIWYSPAALDAARSQRHGSHVPPGDWIFFPPSRAHEPPTPPAN